MGYYDEAIDKHNEQKKAENDIHRRLKIGIEKIAEDIVGDVKRAFEEFAQACIKINKPYKTVYTTLRTYKLWSFYKMNFGVEIYTNKHNQMYKAKHSIGTKCHKVSDKDKVYKEIATDIVGQRVGNWGYEMSTIEIVRKLEKNDVDWSREVKHHFEITLSIN